MTNLPPAGWYLDPENNAHQRYWDGAGWTEHRIAGTGEQPYLAPPTPPENAGGNTVGNAAGVAVGDPAEAPNPIEHTAVIPTVEPVTGLPASAPYIAPEPPFVPHTAQAPTPWYRHWWVIAAGVLVLLLVVIGVVGAIAGDDGTGAPVVSPAPTTSAAVPAPSEPPEPSELSSELTPVLTPVQEPTPTPPPAPSPTGQVGGPAAGGGTGDSFVLPDETGKVLQAAQDDLQAVSGNPFFYSASDDATGQGRMQIVDSGWKVCSQTPAAGTTVTQDDDITFHTVRVSEDCP
ncbi:MAG: hypothetical protein JWQ74_743 [Marmoricola sp.]|nr:hypothetical protein [Marmoricola sp.]